VLYFSKAAAKVLLFYDIRKYFRIFLHFFVNFPFFFFPFSIIWSNFEGTDTASRPTSKLRSHYCANYKL